MSGNWCTHGEHHSYCAECMDGPQPMQARPTGRDAHVVSPKWIEAAGVAITAALDLAPVVAAARPGDDAERGIDIEFESVEAATHARAEVNIALESTEWSGRASAWVWQHETSTGEPMTAAGRAAGFELRLQPRRTR